MRNRVDPATRLGFKSIRIFQGGASAELRARLGRRIFQSTPSQPPIHLFTLLLSPRARHFLSTAPHGSDTGCKLLRALCYTGSLLISLFTSILTLEKTLGVEYTRRFSSPPSHRLLTVSLFFSILAQLAFQTQISNGYIYRKSEAWDGISMGADRPLIAGRIPSWK